MQTRSSFFDAFILILLVLACVVGLAAIWKVRFANHVVVQDVRPVTKVVTKKPVNVPTTTSTTVQVAVTHITPLGMVCDEENVICVNTSTQNMVLANPFSVTGTVQEVLDSPWYWLINAMTGVGQPEQGTFTATSSFFLRDFWIYPPKDPFFKGELILFRRDSQGIRKNELKIPVRFSHEVTKLPLVFVSGPASDTDETCPKTDDGTTSWLSPWPYTLAVSKTSFPIEAAVQALIRYRGAITAGVTTAVPEWMRLDFFSFESGNAKIALKGDGTIGGCLQKAIQAELEKTLKHFSRVKHVDVVFTKS